MKWLQAIMVALLLSHSAYAQSKTPFRASATKKAMKRLKMSHLSRSGVVDTGPALTYQTSLYGEGNVVVTFTTQRSAEWKSTVSRGGTVELDNQKLELFQGEAVIRGIRYPAAGSIVGKNMILSFPGRERGSRGTRQRVYTLTTPVESDGISDVRVASSPAAVFHDKTCGDNHSEEPLSSHPRTIKPLSVNIKSNKSYRVITLGTVADRELYAIHGKDTNAFIASIVNTADVLFERQLGIRFQIVRQHAYSDISPLSLAQTDPAALLKAFASNNENPTIMGIAAGTFDTDVDVKHLFSGKDLDGTTVGIAYLSAVCYQPKSAYGLTQVTSTAAAPYFFAHEIGHNLGARHEQAMFGSMSIMSPKISIGSAFSQASMDQINQHLSYFGSCLESKEMAPNLTDAKLTITQQRDQRGLKFSGRLISAAGEGVSDIEITLLIGRRKVNVKTNQLGRYWYVARRGEVQRRAAISAATTSGEAKSRIITAMAI